MIQHSLTFLLFLLLKKESVKFYSRSPWLSILRPTQSQFDWFQGHGSTTRLPVLSNLVNGQAVDFLVNTLDDRTERLVVLHGLGDGGVVVLGVDRCVAAHPTNPELLHAVQRVQLVLKSGCLVRFGLEIVSNKSGRLSISQLLKLDRTLPFFSWKHFFLYLQTILLTKGANTSLLLLLS